MKISKMRLDSGGLKLCVVSQRTKEALRVLKERGIKLGKPKGTIQKSVLDKYRSKINEWCRLGFPYQETSKGFEGFLNCFNPLCKDKKNIL
jgi:hypothetical protein